MADIIGIGSALFDTLMQTERFPKEDTKIQGVATKLQGGGPCATALVAAAKLGVSAAYIGTLGDDVYGMFIKQAMARYGVNMSRVRTVPDAMSYHSFVLLNRADATRTCVWSKGTVSEPDPGDVDLEMLRQAKFLHLDGHQLKTAKYAACRAREFGVTVSLDAGGLYPGIETLLPLVDVLIPSEEFVMAFTGCGDAYQAAQKLYEQFRPRTLIVTQGKEGGFLYTARGPKRYPAFRVDAVDTNGAGDTFHGAFAAGHVRGMDDYGAACFASAVSALKCMRFGAQDGIPGYEETQAFLNERKGEME